jgi:hypothetical protein
MVWIIKMLEVFSQYTSESEAYGWQFALSTYSRLWIAVTKARIAALRWSQAALSSRAAFDYPH